MIAKERDTEYYIDKARELAALIAANTDRINEQRKIPTDVSDEIADAGFFRLLMPRNLGGAQLDHPDFLRIVHIIAEADGSVGWSFNQNNVFATNSTRMNDKTREEIYSNPRAVITNGPPMSRSRAIKVDGGYSLSGRWNFSSGSDHATWIAALTPIQDTDDNRASPAEMVSRDDMRILLIPKDEVEMVNNWQVNGLRGTASWGFEADGLFIPKHRMYNPGTAPREDGAVYRIPTSLLSRQGLGRSQWGLRGQRWTLRRSLRTARCRVIWIPLRRCCGTGQRHSGRWARQRLYGIRRGRSCARPRALCGRRCRRESR